MRLMKIILHIADIPSSLGPENQEGDSFCVTKRHQYKKKIFFGSHPQIEMDSAPFNPYRQFKYQFDLIDALCADYPSS